MSRLKPILLRIPCRLLHPIRKTLYLANQSDNVIIFFRFGSSLKTLKVYVRLSKMFQNYPESELSFLSIKPIEIVYFNTFGKIRPDGLHFAYG